MVASIRSSSSPASVTTPKALSGDQIAKLSADAEKMRIALQKKPSLGKQPVFAVASSDGTVEKTGLTFAQAKKEAADQTNIAGEFSPGDSLPSMYSVVSSDFAKALPSWPQDMGFNVYDFALDRAPSTKLTGTARPPQTSAPKPSTASKPDSFEGAGGSSSPDKAAGSGGRGSPGVGGSSSPDKAAGSGGGGS
jgi:hypothetical protein